MVHVGEALVLRAHLVCWRGAAWEEREAGSLVEDDGRCIAYALHDVCREKGRVYVAWHRALIRALGLRLALVACVPLRDCLRAKRTHELRAGVLEFHAVMELSHECGGGQPLAKDAEPLEGIRTACEECRLDWQRIGHLA